MEREEHVAILNQLVPDDEDETREVFRIGDLAREFGVTLRTLRFYEDRGLIRPQRQGTTRLYSKRERARLKIILLAKQVGFSLVDIQELMDIYDKGRNLDNPLAKAKGKFEEQLDILERQKLEVEESLEKLRETLEKFHELGRV